MEAKKFFEEQYSVNLGLRERYQRLTSKLAIARTVVFLIAIIGFIYFVNARELTIAIFFTTVFAIVFIVLVKNFNRLKFIRDQHRFKSEINTEELNKLRGDFSGIDGGEEFKVEGHPYADDLDILGDHSLYQLLNRTATYAGKKLLADELLGDERQENFTISKEKLTKRQVNLTELSANPELLQEYQALGRHVQANKQDYENFNKWLAKSDENVGGSRMKFWSYLLPITILIGALIATILSITYYIVLPVIIVNFVLLSRRHKYASEVVESTYKSLKMLKSFIHHIELVSAEKFKAVGLKEMANRFNKNDHHADQEIKRIASLLENLQERNSLLHVFVNVPFLLDIHWLRKIDSWKEKNRENVRAWFDTLAEFELHISLAGQSFSQKGWTMPKVSSEPYRLSCKTIGHPLIKSEDSVTNDFKMEGNGMVILLTGPNMAGKSTFLRTIGINIVMAKMGGVVYATEFEFNATMEIFTGMRVRDDLSDNISSFYAELLRIKELISRAHNGVPTLYFLDEILKGTNSADRHKGAEALIRQLSELGVSGFVSTHDLELGKMAAALNTVENYSFESIIEDGKINFDYKIRQGICQSFNACELMRQMGIKV